MHSPPRRSFAPLSGPLSDIAHATAFLTRLPVPGVLFGDRPLDFARCAWAFPLAALFAALPALAVLGLFWAARGEMSAVSIVLAYAAQAAATGALHEDGAADVADGFWGGGTVERRLAIMRDSRIGTYGVAALIVLFLVRVTGLVELATFSIVAAFIPSLVVGKLALLWHWHACPAARGGDSLAQRFGRPTGRQVLGAAAVALPVVALAASFAPLATFAGVGFAALITALFDRLARAKIGGHTGDTLGAAAVIGECAFLLGLVLAI